MRTFPKPILYVSKCLGFDHCRFNGQTISSETVKMLAPFVEYHTVCPEVEIGLGVPRNPVRVVEAVGRQRLLQPGSELDCTDKMNRFTDSFLARIAEIDGWILKSRSPSCGFVDVKVYPSTGRVASTGKAKGLFGAKVVEKFETLGIEDEGRLTNFRIRENFFTKIFTFAAFREVKASNRMKELVRFQSENKLLLMAQNQKEMRIMGRFVANPDKRPFAAVVCDYEEHLRLAFRIAPRYTSNINVLLHAFGYFSKQLSVEERRFFLDSLELYRQNKVPLSVPNHLISALIVRFKNEYLKSQTIFEPYPQALVEITDSGKGRKM